MNMEYIFFLPNVYQNFPCVIQVVLRTSLKIRNLIFGIRLFTSVVLGPGVALWLRHYATSWKAPGSIPGGVTGDFSRGVRQFHVPGVNSAS
jgi:hypothetical protein